MISYDSLLNDMPKSLYYLDVNPDNVSFGENFTVELTWQNNQDTSEDARTVLDCFFASARSDKGTKSFPWKHDGKAYSVIFDDFLQTADISFEHVSYVRLKIIGKFNEWG